MNFEIFYHTFYLQNNPKKQIEDLEINLNGKPNEPQHTFDFDITQNMINEPKGKFIFFFKGDL
jgi:hypothetical protein